jgi:hypothetical protein
VLGCEKAKEVIEEGQCTNADFNLQAGTVGEFGSSEGAQKLEAFLEATVALEKATLEIEKGLVEACKNMGKDLGLTEDEMKPNGEGIDAKLKGACEPVAAKIESILSAGLEAGATLELEYIPPVCEVDLEASAECAAECDVELQGKAEVECKGGKLVGECKGECTGHCEAKIEGECKGKCEGTCNGECVGTCLAEGGEGQCAGECAGTCNGKCDGMCYAEVKGECKGKCHGECSVEMDAPKCESQAEVKADADCQAACDFKTNAEAKCTKPEIIVAFQAKAEAKAELDKLAATIKANYPKFLALAKKIEVSLGGSIEGFITAVKGLPDAVVDVGVKAGACAAAAISACANISLRFEASISVSASVAGALNTKGS